MTKADIGLTPAGVIRGVTAGGASLWVTTNQGLFKREAGSWQKLLPPAPGCEQPETYLRQNSEPQKALQLADQAIELKEKSAAQKRANRQAYADAWALRSWALGLLGRRAESDESIQKALSESDEKTKPNFAATLYHLGQALLSQGNRSAAVEKFSEARKVDPSGNYGSLAARALREHSVWGDRA